MRIPPMGTLCHSAAGSALVLGIHPYESFGQLTPPKGKTSQRRLRPPGTPSLFLLKSGRRAPTPRPTVSRTVLNEAERDVSRARQRRARRQNRTLWLSAPIEIVLDRS